MRQELKLERCNKHLLTLQTICSTYHMERFVIAIYSMSTRKLLFECHDAPSTRHSRIYHMLVFISANLLQPKMLLNIYVKLTKLHTFQRIQLFLITIRKGYLWILLLVSHALIKAMSGYGMDRLRKLNIFILMKNTMTTQDLSY